MLTKLQELEEMQEMAAQLLAAARALPLGTGPRRRASRDRGISGAESPRDARLAEVGLKAKE
jgi:hypothetical protein